MRLPATQLHRFCILSLIAIQVSCSSDSSGPPVIQPCVEFTPHTLGTTVSGSLATTDCRTVLNPSSYTDMHRVTIAQAGTYLFTESALFDSFLLLLNADGSLIGADDDTGPGTDSRIKALLPAGEYIIGASSYEQPENTTGNYTVTSASTTEGVTCEVVYLVPGLSTDQTLATTDCEGPFLRAGGAPGNGTRLDAYIVRLAAGQAITVTMTSTAVDSYLEVYGGSPLARVAFNDNASGQNAQLSYTAPAAGVYLISATSQTAGATGAYTLQVQ